MSSGDLTFVCKGCKNLISVHKATLGAKGVVKLSFICPKGHRGKRTLYMNKQHEWMSSMIKALYRCLKCGAHVSKVKQRITGGKAILVFKCPKHGRMRKAISDSLWYAIEAASSKIAKTSSVSSTGKTELIAPLPSRSASTGLMSTLENTQYDTVENLSKKLHLSKDKVLSEIEKIYPDGGFITSDKKYFIGKEGIDKLFELIFLKRRVPFKEINHLTNFSSKSIEQILNKLLDLGKLKGIVNTKNNDFILASELDSIIFNYLESGDASS